ncbi:MAG: AAA family ATPase [Clostridia bacterium]|nr:AAA family ATPase [Clostridia bacterium]
MKVIILNGPMGVGKTTVGKYIADRNPGTAFIDGDWCMDIHPFVGSRETKAMAVDNILHMIGNYQKCSVCSMIVLVWLMDDEWVIQRITEGLAALRAEVQSVTLACSSEDLIMRWNQDRSCEWRTDHWLNVSLKSLPGFVSMDNVIDTSGLPVNRVAEIILQQGEPAGREEL